MLEFLNNIKALKVGFKRNIIFNEAKAETEKEVSLRQLGNVWRF